jgi:hypothetical protein
VETSAQEGRPSRAKAHRSTAWAPIECGAHAWLLPPSPPSAHLESATPRLCRDDPGWPGGCERHRRRHRSAVGLFERYALGTLSAQQLAAETGLEATRIRAILMNPIYNGWIRRHRGPNETRKPAPWRSNPPVSDELWARVGEVRRANCRGSGPRRRDRVDLLGGLLSCVCGRRIRSDGAAADRKPRKLHPKR